MTRKKRSASTTKHLTIIAHTENQHPQWQEVLDAIIKGLPAILEGIELVEPVVVDVIDATGNQTVSVPANNEHEEEKAS